MCSSFQLWQCSKIVFLWTPQEGSVPGFLRHLLCTEQYLSCTEAWKRISQPGETSKLSCCINYLLFQWPSATVGLIFYTVNMTFFILKRGHSCTFPRDQHNSWSNFVLIWSSDHLRFCSNCYPFTPPDWQKQTPICPPHQDFHPSCIKLQASPSQTLSALYLFPQDSETSRWHTLKPMPFKNT